MYPLTVNNFFTTYELKGHTKICILMSFCFCIFEMHAFSILLLSYSAFLVWIMRFNVEKLKWKRSGKLKIIEHVQHFLRPLHCQSVFPKMNGKHSIAISMSLRIQFKSCISRCQLHSTVSHQNGNRMGSMHWCDIGIYKIVICCISFIIDLNTFCLCMAWI